MANLAIAVTYRKWDGSAIVPATVMGTMTPVDRCFSRTGGSPVSFGRYWLSDCLTLDGEYADVDDSTATNLVRYVLGCGSGGATAYLARLDDFNPSSDETDPDFCVNSIVEGTPPDCDQFGAGAYLRRDVTAISCSPLDLTATDVGNGVLADRTISITE